MGIVNEKQAQVVSLVPSWTETLLWAGVSVVGRTKFCIHPEEKVNSIPAVGGTKGVDLQKLISLKPDFVVLDREENKKEMADDLVKVGIKILVSHVVDLKSAALFLEEMGRELKSSKLADLALRYKSIDRLNRETFLKKVLLQGNWNDLTSDQIEYVIWKNPFMVIGKDTFIQKVLERAGFEITRSERYPAVEDIELKKKFCFFSSEPFPFEKYFLNLKSEGFKGAIVDGEKISWYGIRNLLFLEDCAE